MLDCSAASLWACQHQRLHSSSQCAAQVADVFRPGSMTVTLSGAHPATSLCEASPWRELPGYALTGTARHSPAGQDATLFLSFDRSAAPAVQPVRPACSPAAQPAPQPPVQAGSPGVQRSGPLVCPVQPRRVADAESAATGSLSHSVGFLEQPQQSLGSSPGAGSMRASPLGSSPPACTVLGFWQQPAAAKPGRAPCADGSSACGSPPAAPSMLSSSLPARTASPALSEAFPDENPSSASTTPRSSLSDSRPGSPGLLLASAGKRVAGKPTGGSPNAPALSLDGLREQFQVQPTGPVQHKSLS